MDRALQQRFERAGRHLRAALAELDLPELDAGLIADFVAHDALGDAFDWTVRVIVESELMISEKARRHLSGAAAELGLRANPDWERIRTR